MSKTFHFDLQRFDSAFSGGSGTETDPYKISSADDLKTLATDVNGGNSYKNKFFTVTQDIDLNGVAYTPIGTKTNRFAGSFDGGANDGFTIKNLTINSTEDYQGLFGYSGLLDSSVPSRTIKNVKLVDVNIKGGSYVGALVGQVNTNVTIDNCTVSGIIEGTSNIGGLIGFNSGTKINGNTFTGTVTGTSKYVGGLIGYHQGQDITATTPNKVDAKITPQDSSYVGALVGQFNPNTRTFGGTNYYHSNVAKATGNGKVKSTTQVFALPDFPDGVEITEGAVQIGNKYFAAADATVKLTIDSTKIASFSITDHPDSDTTDGNIYTFTMIAADLASDGFNYTPAVQDITVTVGGEEVTLKLVTDASGNYYKLDSEKALQALAVYVNGDGTNPPNDCAGKTFKLTGDVDLSTVTNFTAIGNAENKFNGTFDGNGKKISNLTINNSTSDNQGLFGYVGTGGTIQNVTLVNANVTGTSNVGALVGKTGGTVDGTNHYHSNATKAVGSGEGSATKVFEVTLPAGVTATSTNSITIGGKTYYSGTINVTDFASGEISFDDSVTLTTDNGNIVASDDAGNSLTISGLTLSTVGGWKIDNGVATFTDDGKSAGAYINDGKISYRDATTGTTKVELDGVTDISWLSIDGNTVKISSENETVTDVSVKSNAGGYGFELSKPGLNFTGTDDDDTIKLAGDHITVNGGAGNDSINVEGGKNGDSFSVSGGEGNDEIILTSGKTVSLNTADGDDTIKITDGYSELLSTSGFGMGDEIQFFDGSGNTLEAELSTEKSTIAKTTRHSIRLNGISLSKTTGSWAVESDPIIYSTQTTAGATFDGEKKAVVYTTGSDKTPLFEITGLNIEDLKYTGVQGYISVKDTTINFYSTDVFYRDKDKVVSVTPKDEKTYTLALDEDGYWTDNNRASWKKDGNKFTYTSAGETGFYLKENATKIVYDDKRKTFTIEGLSDTVTKNNIGDYITVTDTEVTVGKDALDTTTTVKLTTTADYTIKLGSDVTESKTEAFSWTQDSSNKEKFTYTSAGDTAGYKVNGN